MPVLIATHLALWANAGDARLTEAAGLLIAEPSSIVTVSAVSLWEFALALI